MDNQVRTRKILKDIGAFHDGGHFVYSSGLHGDFYINKDALYAHPLKLDDIGVMLTDCATKAFGPVFDMVVAPAVAGVVLGQYVAYNLSLNTQADILFAYAEKHPTNPGLRTLRRGYQSLVKGRKVLLVDDVVTTGATLMGMAEVVTAYGGQVVGAVAICDRGNVRTLRLVGSSLPLELAIAPLVELDLKTFPANKCPLCKCGRPVDTELGEGAAKAIR